MILRYFFLILIFIASSHLLAQNRRTQKTEDTFNPQYALGLAAGLNNVSGAEFDMIIKNREGGVSKSTLSLIGGYSSRWTGFTSTFDTTGKKTKAWVGGLGVAVVLNNYLFKLNEGAFWALGVTGNVYFRRSVDVLVDNLGNPVVLKGSHLKTFSLFGEIGYQWPVGSRYYLRSHLGAGLMGSPFASSSSSDINGFLFSAGCSLLFKL